MSVVMLLLHVTLVALLEQELGPDDLQTYLPALTLL